MNEKPSFYCNLYISIEPIFNNQVFNFSDKLFSYVKVAITIYAFSNFGEFYAKNTSNSVKLP